MCTVLSYFSACFYFLIARLPTVPVRLRSHTHTHTLAWGTALQGAATIISVVVTREADVCEKPIKRVQALANTPGVLTEVPHTAAACGIESQH